MASARVIGAFAIEDMNWTVRANFASQFALHLVIREFALLLMYARAIEAMI